MGCRICAVTYGPKPEWRTKSVNMPEKDDQRGKGAKTVEAGESFRHLAYAPLGTGNNGAGALADKSERLSNT